jgi:galacturan 1,4-alpha-galacturonidase
VIPKGTFLVGPIVFKGPCVSNPSPSVQIIGQLKAPSSLATFSGPSWIEFNDLHELVLNGSGIVDGQGADAWNNKTCNKEKKCKNLPMVMYSKSTKVSN